MVCAYSVHMYGALSYIQGYQGDIIGFWGGDLVYCVCFPTHHPYVCVCDRTSSIAPACTHIITWFYHSFVLPIQLPPLIYRGIGIRSPRLVASDWSETGSFPGRDEGVRVTNGSRVEASTGCRSPTPDSFSLLRTSDNG